jgi:hypothetical protein
LPYVTQIYQVHKGSAADSEAGGGFNKGIDSERQERHPKRREEGFDEVGGRIKRGIRRDGRMELKKREDGFKEA